MPKEIDDIVEANKDNEEAIKVCHHALMYKVFIRCPRRLMIPWRPTRTTRRPSRCVYTAVVVRIAD